MNKKTVIIAVLVIVVVAGVYVALNNKPPSTTIQQTEQQKTGTISCGKNYSYDITTIGGIDVVKKIAELRTKTNSEGKCEFNIGGDNIGVAQRTEAGQGVISVALFDKGKAEEAANPFDQSAEQYKIDLNAKTLSFEVQLDGSWTIIGDWK